MCGADRLRRKDAEPGAAADLVNLVEQVDDVEAQFHPLQETGVYRLSDAEIDLPITGYGGPVWGPPGRVVLRPLPAVRSAANRVLVVGSVYLILADDV